MANIKDFDDIYDWANAQADENENFIGVELDEKKMERVQAIRDCCKKIVDRDSGVQIVPLQFDNESRNALTQLSFPTPFFTGDKRVMDALETMIDIADSFSIASDAKDIYMTFIVLEIWAKWKTKSEGNA